MTDGGKCITDLVTEATTKAMSETNIQECSTTDPMVTGVPVPAERGSNSGGLPGVVLP